MKELQISEREAGQRFDKYLRKVLSLAPSGFLYKMLRKKNIVLNEKKAVGNEILSVGDTVKLFLSDETFEKFSADAPKWMTSVRKTEERPLSVLYEDDDILLIDKPAGLLSQKAKADDLSANDLVIAYLLSTGAIQEKELTGFTPSICNRLDRNTSGILAAGKSLAGLQLLTGLFRDRSVKKYYHCIVDGILRDAVHLDGFLTKDEKTNRVQIRKEETTGSSRIETAYKPLLFGDDMTLLEVELITGKTHQIRAHLSETGHPILGDHKYASAQSIRKSASFQLKWQLLHAARLKFPELSGRFSYLSGLVITAPDPPAFARMKRYFHEDIEKQGKGKGATTV